MLLLVLTMRPYILFSFRCECVIIHLKKLVVTEIAPLTCLLLDLFHRLEFMLEYAILIWD